MDFDNSAPIWRQLYAEFSARITSGTWPPGHKIPGVRELAVELGVNPNTVQKTLAELERDGLCYTERTAGRYVTENGETIKDKLMQDASAAAKTYAETINSLGLTQETMQTLARQAWEQLTRRTHE